MTERPNRTVTYRRGRAIVLGWIDDVTVSVRPRFQWSTLPCTALLLLGFAGVAEARQQPVPAPPAAVPPAPAPDPQEQTFSKLSIEELSRIDVTSVSKHAEPVSEAAAAVMVVTQDDLRRAGITTLAEALRLVTGVSVGRFDAHTWAISARGFNISTANKMAVFLDGRSLYTPLFAGVFWDVQDYSLGDIDRIEVIRGPAGTLWGANAVNGVINIITKSAIDTKGTYLRTGGGNALGQFAARYGFGWGRDGAVRVFVKYRYSRAELLAGGGDGHDPLRRGMVGFRADRELSSRTRVTFQGDYYRALIGIADRPDSDAHGGNLVGRVAHTFDSGAQLQVQAYFDQTFRNVPRQYAENRKSFDSDVQYRVSLGSRHSLVAGAGYQTSRGTVVPSNVLFFDPAARTTPLYSAFAEDTLALVPGRVDVIAGAKFEHNAYTGFETQPTLRFRWREGGKQTVWLAVSRAVRMPTRYDTDLRFTAGAPFVVLRGNPEFASETMIAREAGYRRQVGDRLSVDTAVFFNSYRDLRSLEPEPPSGFPLVLKNKLTAKTAGVETTVEYEPVAARWRLHGGYAYLHEKFSLLPDSRDTSGGSNEHNDPRHQLWFRSYVNLGDSVELDAVVRTVGRLLQPAVPGYTELTLHFGWSTKRGFELSVIGDNLLHAHHPEFGALNPRPEFRRTGFIQTTWRF